MDAVENEYSFSLSQALLLAPAILPVPPVRALFLADLQGPNQGAAFSRFLYSPADGGPDLLQVLSDHAGLEIRRRLRVTQHLASDRIGQSPARWREDEWQALPIEQLGPFAHLVDLF